MNVLARIVSHKICIEKGDSVHRTIDLTYKEKSQKNKSKMKYENIWEMVTGRSNIRASSAYLSFWLL